MKRYLLFDLDGTLTDPKLGITRCVQYSLQSFGIVEENPDKLEPFIGPPLLDSFKDFYGFDDEKALKAVAKYRERFKDVGLFENEVYDGVPSMLKKLKKNGMRLAIASSKPTVFVERILEHFHIRKYFDVVVGSELDGTRVNKAEVVEEALRQLFKENPIDKEKVFMIGDRKFDVEGAKAFGIESVGVAYGYGGVEELMQAHADYVVRTVKELEELLLRGYSEFDENPGFFLKIWGIVTPFLVFQLIRLLTGMILLQNRSIGTFFRTENMLTICSAIGFLLAGVVIGFRAKELIRLTKKDMHLSHLKRIPRKDYVLLFFATVGISLGCTFLLSLIGLTKESSDYAKVAQTQFGAYFFVGIICYGVISPIAEELLFRGIIYNRMRQYFDVRVAIVASAAFFALYHGNSVQIIYAFVMGMLIAYAYEAFGSFKVPLAIHMGVNILAFALQQKTTKWPWLFGWPACILLLCVGVATTGILIYRRK